MTKVEIKEVEVTGRASVWLRSVSGADASRGETQRVEEANMPAGIEPNGREKAEVDMVHGEVDEIKGRGGRGVEMVKMEMMVAEVEILDQLKEVKMDQLVEMMEVVKEMA